MINAFTKFTEDYININGGINGIVEFKINSEFNYDDDLPDDINLKYKLINELKNNSDESENNNKIYVLEVCKFKNTEIVEHVGYMQAKFRKKEHACSYYDRHNPHMRTLNGDGTFRSDWDPKTKLFYIVREDYDLNDYVPPFSKDDLPINGSYKYLK